VHGKGSLIGKMPGDSWRQFANLRLLYGYMWGHPGKKLLFMGGEFGQRREWAHEESLEWHVLQFPEHAGLRRWVADLNRLYTRETSMHELDNEPEGFAWIDCTDSATSVLSFIRRNRGDEVMLVVVNATPVPHWGYRIGVPGDGYWTECLNSDAACYGGSGLGNAGGVQAEAIPMHSQPYSLALCLPPLAIVFLRGTTAKSCTSTPSRPGSWR